MKRYVYAGLVRVSGEGQKLNESLKNQSTAIELAVKSLGGEPETDIVWYKGQEHTLSNIAAVERKIFKELLEDAKAQKFDAVMVNYFDRRGRNKEQNDQLHRVLFDEGIDFFVLTTKYDYDMPDDELVVDIHSAVGQHAAKRTAKASLEGRISKAERGFYTGSRVFGRSYDKRSGKWTVDEEWKRKITFAAEALDRGESPRAVSQQIGMAWGWLYKVLRNKAGDKLKFTLKSNIFRKYSAEKGNARTFEIDVPPLVEDSQLLKRVIARFDRNKDKFKTARQPDKPIIGFPLKGMVRCAHCGYVMLANTVRYKRIPTEKLQRKRKKLKNESAENCYYGHNLWVGCYLDYRKEHPEGGRGIPKAFPMSVAAEKLEDAVFVALFRELDEETFLTDALKKAEKGPDKKAVVAVDRLKSKSDDLRKQKSRLIKLAMKGLGEDEDIAKAIENLNAEMGKLDTEIAEAESALVLLPDKKRLKDEAVRMEAVLLEGLEDHIRQLYDEAAELPTPEERAKRRCKLLTDPEKRSIALRILNQPGCGVFIRKRKKGLTVEIRTVNYPTLSFII